MHGFFSCHLGTYHGAFPAHSRFPAKHFFQHHRDFTLLRRTKIGSGKGNNHRIGNAKDEKIGSQAIGVSEITHERSCHKGGKAKAHDSQACGKAPVFREPFHQGGHRGDIAGAQPDAANHAVKNIKEHWRMDVDSQRRSQKAGAEESCRYQTGPGRSHPFHHAAQKAGRQTQKQNGNRKGPGGF